MTIAAFFLFGLVIGSFLNVCITRIPEGASIISPRSRCPNCETPIKPYDNVPVLSWIFLGGKCRNCHTSISPMYPVVEVLTALLFVACYLCFGLTLPALKWTFFVCILIVLVVTDFRERILPDVVNWFGVGLGLAFAAYVPPVDGVAPMLTVLDGTRSITVAGEAGSIEVRYKTEEQSIPLNDPEGDALHELFC